MRSRYRYLIATQQLHITCLQVRLQEVFPLPQRLGTKVKEPAKWIRRQWKKPMLHRPNRLVSTRFTRESFTVCPICIGLSCKVPDFKAIDPKATQPTRSRWVSLRKKYDKGVIGGLSSVGSAAWGVAWIDYVMKDEGSYDAELARVEQMEKAIEDAEKNGPPAMNMDWDV